MEKKINIFLESGCGAEYAELEKILQSNFFKTEKKNILNSDEMGIDWGALSVLLPAVYPLVVEFRQILSSFLSYKKTQSTEFKLTLENNGKKLHMEAKNMDVPNIDEFKSFFEIVDQDE